MTKNMKIGLITGGSILGAGVVATAIAVPIVLMQQKSIFRNLPLNTIKYNMDSTTRTSTVYELDPNFNSNANAKLFEKFDNLTNENLQYDFNRILTDFYEVYELDNGILEVEIDRVVVKSLSAPKADHTRTAELSVTYDIETNHRDRDQKITVDKSFTVKPSYITSDEIIGLTETLNYQPGSNHNIDLSDLREIFFGEHDADDFDDLGIFDQIAKLNKENNNTAGVGTGLMSYEVKLSDLAYNPTRVGLDTQFKIPSLSINTYAIPSQSIGMSLNYNQFKNIKKDAFIALLNTGDLNAKYNNIKSYVNGLFAQNLITNISAQDDAAQNHVKLIIETDEGEKGANTYRFTIDYISFSPTK